MICIYVSDSAKYQPNMEDRHVEDVRRQTRENDRQGKEMLEEMTDEHKEIWRKQKVADRQRAFWQRKLNELTSKEHDEQKKQEAERLGKYRESKSKEMTVEEQEEKRKKKSWTTKSISSKKIATHDY